MASEGIATPLRPYSCSEPRLSTWIPFVKPVHPSVGQVGFAPVKTIVTRSFRCLEGSVPIGQAGLPTWKVPKTSIPVVSIPSGAADSAATWSDIVKVPPLLIVMRPSPLYDLSTLTLVQSCAPFFPPTTTFPVPVLHSDS